MPVYRMYDDYYDFDYMYAEEFAPTFTYGRNSGRGGQPQYYGHPRRMPDYGRPRYYRPGMYYGRHPNYYNRRRPYLRPGIGVYPYGVAPYLYY